jgi:hypothetical protein
MMMAMLWGDGDGRYVRNALEVFDYYNNKGCNQASIPQPLRSVKLEDERVVQKRLLQFN